MAQDDRDWERAIDIVRQSVGDLSVDIASQSLGVLDINIDSNSIGDLPISIEAENLTGTLPIDIEGQTIGDLAVDISSQTLGSLDVDLSSQSIGDLAIDISSQSLGDVDILFDDQTTGVSTATQFAAEAGDFNQAIASDVVGAGNISSVSTSTVSNTGGVVLELITARFEGTFTNEVSLLHVPRDSNSAQIVQFSGNPVNHPILLDPGIKVPDGGDFEVTIDNFSSSQVAVDVEYVYREL